jgi:solute carrier family 25 S-adenosylmethionine transporter 26
MNHQEEAAVAASSTMNALTNAMEPSNYNNILMETVSSTTTTTTTTQLLQQQQQQQQQQQPLVSLLSGTALTVSATVARYPLDTATVRLQTSSSKYSITNPGQLFHGCWNGITVPLVANIPAGAAFFGVKDGMEEYLNQHYGLSLTLATGMAIALAQLPHWFLRNPSEVIKTRHQGGLSTTSYCRDINDWIHTYYTGFWCNVMYNLPNDVTKFLTYAALVSTVQPENVAEGAILGGLSTILAYVITTPLDVVRNRIMATTNEKQQDFLQLLQTIAQTEGWQGLFAGTWTRVGKALVSGIVQFAAYEQVKHDVTALLLGTAAAASNPGIV